MFFNKMIRFMAIIKEARIPLQLYTLTGFFLGLLINHVYPNKLVMLAFLSWFFLSTGATLFNDYYDKDKKPLIGLEKPVRIKKDILYSSLILKLTGLVIAIFFLPKLFLFLYLCGLFGSITYSHKHIRIKSKTIPSIFYSFASGVATFVVAASLVSEILSIQNVLGALGTGFFLSTFHIITQIHQTKEDKKRKDITLAIKFGKKTALKICLILLILSTTFILSSIYLSPITNLLLVPVGIYFAITFGMIGKWMLKEKPRTSDNKDYKIMKKLTSILLNLGFILIFVAYFYLTLF
ncbi:hypothetical protein COU60_05415 [Candidatus Pacearchaeota archaeon CG10_big_fil_rev_8_21_14_0_10_34_76]|nr:MAG: hypothetical protein COU60_05415 [Candidatus Pacearchaeota archaeon CG10_big_fil_rev_8_21_14_0_10_34_76]